VRQKVDYELTLSDSKTIYANKRAIAGQCSTSDEVQSCDSDEQLENHGEYMEEHSPMF
jgi:hypothetical protein